MKRLIFALLLVCAGLSWGANEIQFWGDPLEAGLYAAVMRNSDTYAWDADAVEFAAAPDWADMAIALTEHALFKGLYTATFPAVARGMYTIAIYRKDNPSADPTASDARLGVEQQWAWGGTAEVAIVDTMDALEGSGDATLAKQDEIIALFGDVVDETELVAIIEAVLDARGYTATRAAYMDYLDTIIKRTFGGRF